MKYPTAASISVEIQQEEDFKTSWALQYYVEIKVFPKVLTKSTISDKNPENINLK